MAAQGASPVAIVGHSMGGKVAMQVALTAPEQVRRVAVADIAPRVLPLAFRTTSPRPCWPCPPHLTRQEADAALAPAVRTRRCAASCCNIFRSGAGWRIGLANIAAALPVIAAWDDPGVLYSGPALFVSGALSNYVRGRSIALASPGCSRRPRFVVIKDAGHWLARRAARRLQRDAGGRFSRRSDAAAAASLGAGAEVEQAGDRDLVADQDRLGAGVAPVRPAFEVWLNEATRRLWSSNT
ncbi:MAG: alpha/beta fold hydrolase [Acetobacteraceae bacterium]